VVEVTTVEDLDRRLRAGARRLDGWRLVGLDLTGRGEDLARCDVAQALLLGCRLTEEDERALRTRGAIVFPDIPDTPVDPYRSTLYSPTDLYDSTPYDVSLDARAYAWSQHHDGPEDSIARSLHDHAIDVALTSWVGGRRVVGVMGGHASVRGSEEYARAARLGRALGSRLTVATGGGPGAMEAANLGAYLATAPPEALDEALESLAQVPGYRPSIDAWAATALEVVERQPGGGESLGVPTWHYGHEPPNAFATSIAKYFRNSQREAVLLEVCDAGIVFLPGAAGTVQEVFQDACENYYADPSSLAPMVLLGHEHWTRTLPVWPLLKALAAERAMAPHVHLVDSVEEATELLGG
jgi:predicted Rossmann-fold nucleotide-binding protein